MTFCICVIYALLSCTQVTAPALPSTNAAVPKSNKQPPAERGIVYSSFNGGKNWQAIGKGLPQDLQVSYLAGLDEEIILASENYGLYKRERSSGKWEPLAPHFLPNQKITALLVDRGVIYIGVYKKGIYTSNDRGNTWQSMNHNLKDLAVVSLLKTGEDIWVGADNGIYKTKVQTINWQSVFQEAQVTSLASDEHQIIAGTHKGIISSTNGGRSWELIRKGMTTVNLCIADHRIIAMYMMHAMEISKNGGKSWEKVHMELPQSDYVFETVVYQNTLVSNHHEGIYVSGDWGQHWALAYPTPEEKFVDLYLHEGILYGGTIKR